VPHLGIIESSNIPAVVVIYAAATYLRWSKDPSVLYIYALMATRCRRSRVCWLDDRVWLYEFPWLSLTTFLFGTIFRALAPSFHNCRLDIERCIMANLIRTTILIIFKTTSKASSWTPTSVPVEGSSPGQMECILRLARLPPFSLIGVFYKKGTREQELSAWALDLARLTQIISR